MYFTNEMKEKYGKIKIIDDIEILVTNDSFIKEYSYELLLIIETTINPSVNDTYIYEVNQATIVGLFTKLYKYFGIIIRSYENSEYDITALINRPLYEAFVIMKYLILNGPNSQRHFRLVSYKNRYKKMLELEKPEGIGYVMLEKIKHDISTDGFTIDDFKEETGKPKNQRWKLDGKNFSQIHGNVENPLTYPYAFGMMSETVHSGWGDIRQNHLNWHERKMAAPNMELYKKNNLRILIPVFSIMIEATEEFLKWHDRKDEIIITEEHKRINNLLSQYVLTKYDTTPDEYIEE